MKHTAETLIEAGYPVVTICKDRNGECLYSLQRNQIRFEKGEWEPIAQRYEDGPFSCQASLAFEDEINIPNLPWHKIGHGEKLEVDLRTLK